MRKLVVASESQFECYAEGLDRHDRDRAYSRAYRNVNERVLSSVLWRNPVYHNASKDCYGQAIQ
jgi:hypothetical protein